MYPIIKYSIYNIIKNNIYNNIKIINLLEFNNIFIILKFLYIISWHSYNEFTTEYNNNNIYNIYHILHDNIQLITNPNYFIIIAYNIINLEFIGCAMLDNYDDIIFKNILSPWLCNNLITYKYRGFGLSTLILNTFNTFYKKLYFNKTYYLYCNKSLIKYYKKHGYHFICSYNQYGHIKYLFSR